MATKNLYLGTVGPFMIEDDDPLFVDPAQVARKEDISDALTAATLHATDSKTTPVDADELPLLDSEDSFSLKKLTLTNLKNWILGFVGQYKSSTWTITPTNLTVSGTPTYTGTYTRVGDRVIGEITVASTVSTESTYTSTYFNLPYAPAGYSIVTALDAQHNTSLDNGVTAAGNLYSPTWAAASLVILSFSYRTTAAF